MNNDIAQRHVKAAACFNNRFFYMAMDLCNSCDLNYRNASSKQLLVELTLVKLCQLVVAPQPQQATQPAIKKITPAAAPQAVPQQQQPAPAAQPPRAQAAPAPQQPSATQQPQPQAQAPQPQQAPHHAAPATPMPGTAAPSRPVAGPLGNKPRIMVNVTNTQAQTAQANAPSKPQRTQLFTVEQLLEAWHTYIDQHPQERALVTTMNYAAPQRVDSDEHYEMVVGSPTEKNHVEEHKAELMSFLSNALNNDRIVLDVKVSEVPIETPKILSPREVVEQIKSHNPGFNQFLKDFELGLA